MKMATEYLHLETNNLRPLVEHLFGNGSWESKSWELLGTTATSINLDDIDGGNQIAVDKDGDKVLEYHYILPIIKKEDSITFKEKCAVLGIQVDFLTHEEAIVKWNELKALKPVAEVK